MKTSVSCLIAMVGTVALIASASANAADGLVVPAAETVWPQWQARITVQSVAVSPLSVARPLDTLPATRSAAGTAVLGDYLLASPGFGNLRASGGLMFGAMGGDATGSLPYLGLGFDSQSLLSGLSLTADLGWVAGGSVSRALFGNQGTQNLIREMRLAPVLQLGLRYAF